METISQMVVCGCWNECVMYFNLKAAAALLTFHDKVKCDSLWRIGQIWLFAHQDLHVSKFTEPNSVFTSLLFSLHYY